jgi:RsiW-degrading membrane proteinase PrsW (M82 family)
MISPFRKMIVLLLVLQAASTIFLWTLDDLNEISEVIFALFLAIDLVSFAMISYTYRKEKQVEPPNKTWLIIGSALIAVLLFSSLLVR